MIDGQVAGTIQVSEASESGQARAGRRASQIKSAAAQPVFADTLCVAPNQSLFLVNVFHLKICMNLHHTFRGLSPSTFLEI